VLGTDSPVVRGVAEVEHQSQVFELDLALGLANVQDQDSIRDAQFGDSVAYCCRTLHQAAVVS
jgi:hypothetical protein